MKFRTFNVLSLASLCAFTAAAGYTASLLDEAGNQIAMAVEEGGLTDCDATSFIDTDAGKVGCFKPVIAIVDETFFTTDDEVTVEETQE